MMYGSGRYNTLSGYLKAVYGESLYKISLDAGMTCPNRDGRAGLGGCIFCSAEGSGDFSKPLHSDSGDIDIQIEAAKKMVEKKFTGTRYIAYFQSFTNTYAPVDVLERIFMPVIMRDDIAVLDIATRPDCLEPDKLELIRRLAEIKPVWVELGLQSADDNTAQLINRCYPTAVYDRAVEALHRAGAEVITHMIIGLPGETKEDMLKTAAHIARCGSDGIKLQLLHVLSGTRLAEIYSGGGFEVLTEEQYVDIVTDIIAILPESMVIHRITGDGDRRKLIAPLWSLRKHHVLNSINHALRDKEIVQGQLAVSACSR